MSLPERLDSLLIEDAFQKFSNWFRNVFGETCYWLARKITWGYIAIMLAALALWMWRVHGITLFMMLTGLMIANLTHAAYTIIKAARILDARAKANGFVTAMSPYRPYERLGPTRLYSLALAISIPILVCIVDRPPVLIESGLFACAFPVITCSIYFLSCTPQPRKPKKAKVRAPILEALPQGT